MSPTGPYVFFDVLRGALRKVMDPLEGVKVGLMLNHDYRVNCEGFGRTGCSNGGYIAMGFEEFEVGDKNGAKAKFHGILDAMPTPLGNQSHSYQGKELFFEFFRYLTGQGVYNAHNGWTDFGTNNKFNLDKEIPDPTGMRRSKPGPQSSPVTQRRSSPAENARRCSPSIPCSSFRTRKTIQMRRFRHLFSAADSARHKPNFRTSSATCMTPTSRTVTMAQRRTCLTSRM
jgi:hypothetical protein